jgi:hypothetical protein
MTTSFNSLLAQVPGLASSFNDIFNNVRGESATPPAPVAPPAPRDIHCVGDDDTTDLF